MDRKFLKTATILLFICLLAALVLAFLQTHWAMDDTIIKNYLWFFIAAFIILHLYKKLQKLEQELILFDKIVIYAGMIVLVGNLVLDAKILYTIKKYQGKTTSDNLQRLDSDLVDLKAYLKDLHKKDNNIKEVE